MDLETVGFIPIRGGSKSIPFKNIKLINNKPLIYWTLKEACENENIDKVFVSTDSEKIKEIVENFHFRKCSVISRSAETATDNATSESALVEFCKNVLFENVFFIQATSPLLESRHLSEAFDIFKSNDIDSVISVVKNKNFFWEQSSSVEVTPLNYNPLNRPRRQDFKGNFQENGSFYLSKRKLIIDSNCRISGKIGFYEMPEYTAYEIDEPHDWIIIENLIKKYKTKPESKEIKLVLTDVDGVLTDAGMYYTNDGNELKKFSTYDGKAFELLKNNNVKTGIITSENTVIVANRAEKIKSDYLFQGVKDKLKIVRMLCEQEGITFSQVAYIGDDLNDIEVLQEVGLKACPINARHEVRNIENILILNSKGGDGAFREFVDNYILRNKP